MLFNTLKISAEDAQRLRNTLKTRKLLNAVKAYAWLCKDLELLEKEPALRRELEAKASFTKNLGAFMAPVFSLEEDAFGSYYVRNQTPKNEGDLTFGVGAALNWKFSSLSGLSFFLVGTEAKKVLFLEGPYPNKERNQYPYNKKQLIFKLANYFYNRRPLYEKIHKSLLENTAALTALTNQEFTEDLTLLFSVKSSPQTIPDFLIAEENLKTRALKEFWKKETRTPLGTVAGYLKKEENGYKSFSSLKMEISLKEKNELSFATAEGYNYNTPRTEETYPDMKAMLLANTNDFLQQITASTNFAAEIYEKVKTKILLKNL